jgi:XTP/dITP diphosphohydrolase
MGNINENIIVCASNNQHKIVEIEAITAKFGMKVISRNDAGVPPFEIEEDGDTFEANSYKKAAEILAVCGKPTLADDSGLMVDYLDGAPGVYSARFAGAPTDSGQDRVDGENNKKLLALMEGVPAEKRTAKFVSVITMIFPAEDDKFKPGKVLVARGECPGLVLTEEHGDGGFGYDPLFLPNGCDRTFAEITAEEKNAVSHRANALKELERLLIENGYTK